MMRKRSRARLPDAAARVKAAVKAASVRSGRWEEGEEEEVGEDDEDDDAEDDEEEEEWGLSAAAVGGGGAPPPGTSIGTSITPHWARTPKSL